MWTVLLLACAGMTLADEFEITRSTIDGGGLMRSTGGDFELSGTIGQPDAGVLAGDNFELAGGFWFALAPGDCQEDGDVDIFDYEAFSLCITGPKVPLETECVCYDVNHDGDVSLADFAIVQSAYTG